jgi:hypothetical protein
MDGLQINLETRYLGAWQEINARLQSRQSVSVAFATIAWAVLGYTISSYTQPEPTHYIWIGLLLPVVSLAYSSWLIHNDLTIGILSKFCSECEMWDYKDDHNKNPSWHSPDQGWMSMALKYRKLSDYGFLIIIVATCVPAVIEAFKVMPNKALYGILYLILGSFGPISAYLVSRNQKRREEILKEWKIVQADSKLKFQKTTSY